MKRVMTVSVISVLVFLMSFAGAGEKKLLPSGTHIIKTDGGMDLALTIPAGFSLDKGNSLIVLLHGAQMQDLNDVKSVWSGWTDSFSRSGYIVVVPRSKTNPNAWDAKDIDDLAKFCKKIADDYNVLNRQGVAVGHSSGADGAARLVTTEPRLFSAIVSLGGQTRPETATLKNNNIGVFLFHFNGDNVVNISFAKQLEENLKKAGVNVTLKTEDMNSHAIEHYAQRALSPTTSWLSNWMKDEARKLTSVGQDNNLNWQVLS
ncbi:MAG: hypothetical protein N2234_08080, partial [Planctomycetota bacterium]|nr:hypothetical protein [Planctomycetota bacterium]